MPEAEHPDAWIRVSVKDNGIGIPADLLPKIFDLFVQGERTIDRAQGGLGLGLTIVRGLVDLHGGTVSAHSEGPGKGSEFVVAFPATDVESVDDEVVDAPNRPEKKRSPSGIRILVVDDNVDAAEMVAEGLRTFDHEVAFAHDGPQALREVESFQPHVLVIDIGLPVMDGYELARRLRERERERGASERLRLVVVTGYGQAIDRQRSADAGIDVHLLKPIDLHVLAAAVVEKPTPLLPQPATDTVVS